MKSQKIIFMSSALGNSGKAVIFIKKDYWSFFSLRSTSASTKKERSAVPLTPLGGARIRPSSATPSAGGNGGGPPGMAQSIGSAEAGVLRGSGADSTSEEEETSRYGH